MKEKRINAWIIHGFALLHVTVNILCSVLEARDTLLLTVLTMTLACILCFRMNLTVEITVMALILVNIVGFVLGNIGAQLMPEVISHLWQHAITTFLVTEILGWSLYAFAHRFSPYGPAGYERDQSWYRNATWLVVAIAIVFGIRLYIDVNFSGNILLENSGVMALLIFTTSVSLVFMVNFAIQMQREASSQRTRRHQAEFRYMTLKHQVNPHFLFNSLNVLDAIVMEGTKEEASEYIHKMAAIYRYLMQVEGKRLVPLSQEITFAANYRDLIHIRFPEGLEFKVDLTNREGFIVPCTLQLLLENAIKHNAISTDNPLVITLSSTPRSITLSNNRIPKISTYSASTGIGLQYIRNQYRDIAGAEIDVVETSDSFAVTVPILQELE